MFKQLINHYGNAAVEALVHPHEPDRLILKTTEDIDPLLELTKIQRDDFNSFSPAERSKHLLYPVANIPLAIHEQSVREEWDKTQWKRWLNDPDNKALRIWGGKV